ncbi:pyridoxal-dependent decarboxylase [Muricauda sp. MAR_2010_75]|uniref:pyridoxal phosphate-dependent decarboxylase family protein n=1 Tax=Allomuricauda sp. MAR_2010_75 TaxID=1250232 RepID=UPI00055E5DED|nr:pyridoxal-dependent decarboxylase [Muricauda sp. MAR_2010_75]
MNEVLKRDLDQMGILLEGIKKEGLSFLRDINEIPTSTQPKVPAGNPLNHKGKGAIAAFEEFSERFKPIMVGSPGPRYWGYVTGGSTPAAIMGDWLTSIYDQNPQGIKGNGDISALLELEALDLLLELFDLPKQYTGGFVTGAMMSNFTCLATARQWLGNEQGMDVSKEGLFNCPEIKVLSATPHSSSIKALALLGMGSTNIIQVETMQGNREAIAMDSLEQQIQELNGAPFLLISSAGTVNSGDFDDFEAISALKSKYKFWWHIDAAFGAFVSCSPKYKHLVKGWEDADSITVDGHKWLNVPYENAVFFIKEKHNKLQVETFQNSNAPYLGDIAENFSYLNLLPENSRRLKALPVWFTLKAYGKEGYQSIVENNIQLAKDLGEWIQNHHQLELLSAVNLNIVSFTWKNADHETIDEFLNRLNARGKVFMTPSIYKGRKGIRAALVNWRTSPMDIDIAINEIEATLQSF